MKISIMAVVAGALVAGSIAIPEPGSKGESAVGSFGPTLPPVLEPRVRVINDRQDAVDVWYSARGTPALRLLGSVDPMVTTTLVIPADVTQMQILVIAQATRERYVTASVEIGGLTEVLLEITPDLGASTFHAEDLRVSLSR